MGSKPNATGLNDAIMSLQAPGVAAYTISLFVFWITSPYIQVGLSTYSRMKEKGAHNLTNSLQSTCFTFVLLRVQILYTSIFFSSTKLWLYAFFIYFSEE